MGIGTFKIDTQNKKESLEGLFNSHKLGQNYIDTSYLYEQGNVMELISDFLKKADRNQLFITTKLEPFIEKKEDVEKQLNSYLKILWIDYIDCLMLHSPAFTKIGLIETYQEIEKLHKKWNVKYIWVSNTNPDELKEISKHCKISIFEWVYNLECKIYEDIGILDFCKKENIKFIGYQPLRRNRTAKRNYPLLVKLANKYEKNHNQIILNRLVKEKNIIPIVKTTDKIKIKENIDSLSFTMKPEDYQRMNNFRSSEFDQIEIDWEWKWGITIDQLANQFE